MKILKFLLLAIVILPLTFQSCREKEDETAKLEIFIQKEDASVYGAIVRLYMNENDFKAQNDNYADEEKTDLLGYALFTGLPASQYYISVIYDGAHDSYDNLNGNYDMATTQLGTKLNKTIDLEPATKLTIEVKNLANIGIADAIVKLYDSESAMSDTANDITTKQTNGMGLVEFSHLLTKKYYYSITTDSVTYNYSSDGELPTNTNTINYITIDPNKSALVVKVFQTETSTTIDSAIVTLYETEEAWRNGEPAANIEENTIETNEEGEALFYNLGEKRYYIGVIYDDGNLSYDNNTGLHSMESPTVLGESKQISIDIKRSTQLEIYVQESNEIPISDVEIRLYNTEMDLINGENMIGSAQSTSTNGVALFDHLFPQVYYFSVTANGTTINYYPENPLTESTTNHITITLSVYSYLNILVIDKTTSNIMPNSLVALFNTEEAWNTGEPIAEGPLRTNVFGEVHFHKLEPKQYYAKAYTATQSNNNGDDADLGELLPGMEYNMTIRISPNNRKGSGEAKTIVDIKSKKRLIKVAYGR